MIRHLLRMVWNRKRVNAWILAEMLLSFVALFVMLSLGAYYLDNYLRPIGFDVDDVWTVEVTIPRAERRGASIDKSMAQLNRLRHHVQAQPQIKAYGEAIILPYEGSTWNNDFAFGQKEILCHMGFASIGFDDVMGLQLVEGRWFNEDDLVLERIPAVINQALKKELFGDVNPIGQVFTKESSKFECRVVGVIDEYHPFGEFEPRRPFCFFPMTSKHAARPPEFLILKVEPGTSVDFEAELVRDLERIASGWSFRIRTLDSMRGQYMKERTAFMLVAGLIGFFMLIMVGMGMVGVLWQNVTQRVNEIGVRRAKGATRRKIYLQILGEFLVITTLAIGLAMVFLVQLPLLGIHASFRHMVLVQGFLAAAGITYLLTLISSLYPSWLATTINPADALHYE